MEGGDSLAEEGGDSLPEEGGDSSEEGGDNSEEGGGQGSDVVVKWREVTVYQEPQLTLSRTGNTMVLSTPSSHEDQFPGARIYLLLYKGGNAGRFSIQLLQRSVDFIKVLQNLAIWRLGLSLSDQDLSLGA